MKRLLSRHLPQTRDSEYLAHSPVFPYHRSMISISHRLSLTAALLALGFGLSSARAAGVPEPFADLAERLLPAVVNISSTQTAKQEEAPPPDADASPYDQFFKDFMGHGGGPGGPRQKSTSLGSGFVIDPAGYVVTNNHVIEGADDITVILHDDTHLKATLVGRDEKADLALLKVTSEHPLPSVVFGDSEKERVGDWVMAVGNPFGLGGTVTTGIISARSREINSNGGPYDDFLQTDAPINRGNSGGPLFNTEGEVIGINSAIFSPSGGSIGIGFAIPSSVAGHVIGQIREFGHVRRGYAGLRIQDLDAETVQDLALAKPSGVLVAGLIRGGPAEAAGVKPGDVVLSIGGADTPDVKHFNRVVMDARVDSEVPVTLAHGSDVRTVTLKVGEAKADQPDQVASLPKNADAGPPPGAPVAALGLTLSPATPDLKSKYSLGDNAQVVVTAVTKDGPAADKDVKPGDVVIEVAQEEVKGPADVTRKIDEARSAGRKSVLMLIDRGGDLRFVAVRIDQG
jgi:serine protease Do